MFSKIISIIIVGVFLTIFSSSCLYDVLPDPSLSQEPPCDTIAMSFAMNIQPIISKCLSCHDDVRQSGGIKLQSFDDIKPLADNGRLYGSISKSPGYTPMPPDIDLKSCEVKQIKAWIDAGALDN